MPLAAGIAVADATVYYDKEYTYEVPSHLEGHIFIGSMVLVPFGRGKGKPRTGVVLSLEETDGFAKNIKSILDTAPSGTSLNDELLAIVKYLKEATFCTWFEAVRAVIPHGAQYKPFFSKEEGWKLKAKITRHTEDYYKLSDNWEEMLAAAKRVSAKQREVIEFLKNGIRSKNIILEECSVGSGVLDTLVKNGVAVKSLRDRESSPYTSKHSQGEGLNYRYSEEQEKVIKGLKADMDLPKPKPALLHGVTGSGKTPVFLELIDYSLKKGKTALVLVPEIGLTPQMINKLCESFGDRVAVQHSALSHTERLLQWRQIQRGETPVVVGTRSAVFAPLDNVGIIIIDEEQEHTYKSESSPRYDALDVARRRASYHGALCLMASATPAVSDYYMAESGRFNLYSLNERYGSMPLPNVEMVDMRQDAPLLGGTAVISGRLAAELGANIEKGEQSILLLNRRGYHRAGICRDCNSAIKCGDCSVAMVYHKAGPKLLCHYCGKSEEPPEKCPSCGGEIRYMGFGTQLIEEELAQLFPGAGILRMDLDSTGQKGSHSRMFQSFGEGKYDILLGTQMVAKGLDFEKVSLVGVIGIDSLLFGQGYRAFENVFSLVTQVVGRAGRAGAESHGRALIQTADPDNPVLNMAARQDYKAFYSQEVQFRKLALYPPFCNICTFGFSSESEGDSFSCAKSFSAFLSKYAAQTPNLPLRILGPAPMGVFQVAGSYRYRLTLKCRADKSFRQLARKALSEYNKEGLPRKAAVWLDFNL